MVQFIRTVLRRESGTPGFVFSRPLVLLQSDGWGRVGVCDPEGFEKIRSKGIRLGENPNDLYSLETAADVDSLRDLLANHRDCMGNPACLVMNFCPANLDFKKMREGGFSKLELMPLFRGLPGRWSRPGLIESYRSGIKQGVFFPALQGLTQFCTFAVEQALVHNNERAHLLRILWEEDTPFIHWRMPWVGYEYWHPEKPQAGFLPAEIQRTLVRRGCELLLALFKTAPISACAPGYRANLATYEAWSHHGIRVAQNSTGEGLKAPNIGPNGILQLHRVLDFEPCRKEVEVDRYLEIAQVCFSRGLPFVVSVPSMNFHSSIKDFSTPSLAALDALLMALESKYPELLYITDRDLYSIIINGRFRRGNDQVSLSVTLQAN